jgi:hypothetical protein
MIQFHARKHHHPCAARMSGTGVKTDTTKGHPRAVAVKEEDAFHAQAPEMNQLNSTHNQLRSACVSSRCRRNNCRSTLTARKWRKSGKKDTRECAETLPVNMPHKRWQHSHNIGHSWKWSPTRTNTKEGIGSQDRDGIQVGRQEKTSWPLMIGSRLSEMKSGRGT